MATGAVTTLRTAIDSKYLSLGGNSSFLGLPTSAEFNLSDGWGQQNFQGGYILWKSGQAAIAYDTRAINGLPADSGHGSTSNWSVDFWNNQTMSGIPVYTKTEAAGELRFVAGQGAPVGTRGIQEDHFSARWNTTSYFAGGIYNFTNQADDGVRVYVDDVNIIDKWQDQPFTTNTASTFVSQGFHNIRVDYFENQGVAANTLRWDLTHPMNEWLGEFFNNQNLQGQAVGFTSAGTSFLSRDWGTGHEAGIAIANDHFSDRWTTIRFFQGGTYEFSNQADDGVRIWVDDKLALDRWVDQGLTLNKFNVSLSEGYHKLRVEHYENQGVSALNLNWKQLSNLLNQPNIPPSGPVIIPINTGTAGKAGVLAGQVDPTFTWNYTGNYNDPLYRAYTNNNQDDWIMADSDLWDNRHYGPDVTATMPDFKGVTYLYTTFDLPTGATNIKLNFTQLAADDRVIASLNGKQLGAFSGGADPASGTQGVMMDGNAVYSSQLFTTTSGSHLFIDPSLFNVGGTNVLRFWVNNTGTRDPMAPAKPLANNPTVDTAVLGVVGSLFYDRPGTVSIALPSSSGTSRILDAYQQAGGLAVLGNPVQAVKALENGAYELDLPNGQFFWAPGMTNPTYYEYVNGSLTMPATYWRGEYFNNANWSGDPVLVRGQRYLQEDWGAGSPFPSVPSENFSVRWTSQQAFDRGTYQFMSDHDDGFQVIANGQTAIDRLVNVAEKTNGYASFAQSGQYGVQVKYFENLGLARAKLDWGKVSAFVVGLSSNNQLTQSVVDDFLRQGGYDKLGLPQNDVHPWAGGTIQDFDRGVNGRGGIMRANGSNDAFWVGGDVWQTFLAKGGAAGVGYPINELHTWGKGVIQDFDGGSGGRGGLMKANGSNAFYWVTGSIWNRYLSAGGSTGILGYPTSDRYRLTDGVIRQDFQGGFIYQTSRGTFSLYGGIKDYYFNRAGGENGKLGLPTSGEYNWNGKTRQNFANGYIVWTGGGAVGYRLDGSLLFPPPKISGGTFDESPLFPNPTSQNPLKGFRHPLLGGGTVTQEPGGVFSHQGREQYAIDFAVPLGTPVYAMRSGRVVGIRDIYPDTGGGAENYNKFNYVLIEHDGGYYSAYLHLQQGFDSKVGLKVGDTVQAGQLVGYSGNSGWSTGPHLHVEVQKGKWGQTVPFVINSSKTGGDSQGNVTISGNPLSIDGSIDKYPLSISRYGNKALEYAKKTILLIHGWLSNKDDGELQHLAKVLESKYGDSAQVLLLDWGSIAKAGLDTSLVPYNTAKWVHGVAEWAQKELISLGINHDQTQIFGHSLGSFVGAEIANLFNSDKTDLNKRGKVEEFVALDPAWAPTPYDISGTGEGVPNFKDLATKTLAFAASDASQYDSLPGDNDLAGTAQKSFIIKFDGHSPRYPNLNPAILGEYHKAVVDVVANALQGSLFDSLTSNVVLEDVFDNNGDMTTPPFIPGGLFVPTGKHEGVIYAKYSGQESDPWQAYTWKEVGIA